MRENVVGLILHQHMGLNSNPLNVGRELEKMSVEQCSHTIQVLLE